MEEPAVCSLFAVLCVLSLFRLPDGECDEHSEEEQYEACYEEGGSDAEAVSEEPAEERSEHCSRDMDPLEGAHGNADLLFGGPCRGYGEGNREHAGAEALQRPCEDELGRVPHDEEEEIADRDGEAGSEEHGLPAVEIGKPSPDRGRDEGNDEAYREGDSGEEVDIFRSCPEIAGDEEREERNDHGVAAAHHEDCS